MGIPASASGGTLADPRPHDMDAQDCRAMQDMLDMVGRRWTGAVLLACTRGARRFGEYRRLVAGISDRLLSQRLRELESLGLLERQVIPTTPVQVLYHPTARGRELVEALHPLVAWGSRHMTGEHSCGSPGH
jgi:DNA-binding HxlR family transcriptional regulator